jgi:CMP-N,N'-diacetyllegionaminic acid synthase
MNNLKKIKNLFFIPARSGSKGIKNKNLQKFQNKTLIQHTVDFARKIDPGNSAVCLSSNSKKYLSLANAQYKFLRSTKNSGDNSKISDSLYESLINFRIKFGISFENIIILQPTSPLRKKLDVEKGLKLLQVNKSVISVKNIERSKDFIFKLKKNKKIIFPQKINTPNRQFNLQYFTPCGSFYMIKYKTFLKKKCFYINKSLGYETKFPANIDINYKIDLHITNLICKK